MSLKFDKTSFSYLLPIHFYFRMANYSVTFRLLDLELQILDADLQAHDRFVLHFVLQ